MRSTTMSRASLSMLIAAALLAVFAIAGTASASAACSQPFNCFAGDDGDQASGPGGLTDWQDIAGSVTSADDPAKGVDTKFSGGAKELNPGGWDFILGSNTPKTDLLKGWSLFDGRFLEGSFERAKQSGDTFLAFELNQDAAGPRSSTAGIPIPHRSSGDILFTYDVATTNKVSFGMCTWDGDATSGQWRQLDGTPVGGAVKECTPLDKSTTPAAEGNVNWNNPIDPNYLTDFKPIGAGQFGEAVVDLGVLGGRFLSNACGPNGWLWMHSRASRSVTSQPKDLLGGAPIASPTCGLTIDKKVSRSGQPGTFVDTDAAHPLAAAVGNTLTYSMTLGNTGTSDLSVDLSDALCDAGTLSGPGGRDGSGDALAGGDSVTYTCTHVITASDANPLVNTACTTGVATLGTASTTLGLAPATICDSAHVAVVPPDQVPPEQPQQQIAPDQQSGTATPPGTQLILGKRITPGRAQLLGPAGCTARAFHARIRGVKVAKVVFKLDGHRIKTLTRKNFRGMYAVRIDPSRLRVGVHRLVVKVTFKRGSATKAKTYRLAFQRCPRALRSPRFTG